MTAVAEILNDTEREAAIVAEGEAMVAAMNRWDANGCFDDHALAHSHRRRMEALIAQRPPTWRPTQAPQVRRAR